MDLSLWAQDILCWVMTLSSVVGGTSVSKESHASVLSVRTCGNSALMERMYTKQAFSYI
jgi:hypothetical protein